MRLKKCSLTGRFLMLSSFVLALLTAGAAIAPAQSWQRGDRDDRYRRDDGYRRNSRQYFQSPVDTTLRDLEQIGAGNSYYNGRERSRFDNAMRHLSEFQNRLDRGRFDRGKLDSAIGDVQHLVDHNALDPGAREVLWNDLSALRAFRSNSGNRYGRDGDDGYRGRGYGDDGYRGRRNRDGDGDRGYGNGGYAYPRN